MKGRHTFFSTALLFLSLTCFSQETNPWIVLFDGTSAKAFRGYKMGDFPNQSWKIEDGALAAQTGVPNIDFVTKESYKDFELVFEWKTSKGGNSGIFFHILEIAGHESGNGNSPNWLNNFEMQIQDDVDFPDKEPKRSAGSLYDLIAPQHKKLKPVGEYNEMKLIVNHNHVEHWLNGTKIVTYEIGSDELNQLIHASKFKDNPDFGKSTDGLIMFQHHGQKVWFRNIKIKRL